LVIEKIREEIRSFLEANENENTTNQDLLDKAKAVLKGKFIAMSACIKGQSDSPPTKLKSINSELQSNINSRGGVDC
jgi:hypothetical protein